MSIRSSLLNTARAARHALPVAQIAPRRAASTASHGSSNMPWALGSAAVFGSLTAFILMPSGEKAAHGVHEHIDAKGAGAHVADGSSKPEHEDEHHDKARELMRKERESGDRPASLDDVTISKDKPVHEGENRPRTEIPSKRDDQKPMSRGASTGDKFNGTIDKHVEGDNAATKSDESVHKLASGSSGKSTGDKAEETVDKVKDAAGSAVDKAKASAGSMLDKAKDAAGSVADKAKDAAGSAKEAADSAMGKAKETADSASSKAKETADSAASKAGSAIGQAKEAVDSKSTSTSSPKSSSSSSTPDNVDDSDKPSDSEIKDSIKQAERSNSPLATMAEEVDESASAKRI